MHDTLYFKKIKNGIVEKIFRIEDRKMFLEILDQNHPCGSPVYFSSPRKRDDYVNDIKNDILRINHEEVEHIIKQWNLG